MINGIDLELDDLFVGRDAILEKLFNLFKISKSKKEHSVYVLLNAPGVGKTTLIQHFGKLLEDEGKGIFVRIACSSKYVSADHLNKDLIFLIEDLLHEKRDLIADYINEEKPGRDKVWLNKKLTDLKKELKEIHSKEKTTLSDPVDLFLKFSKVIPIFFASDEIQEFQKTTIKGPEGEEETVLHYFTRILKDLINAQLFMVLSGTQYHILSQIGNKIGSPIRNKALPLVLSNFSLNEVEQYISEYKNLLLKDENYASKETLLTILKHYARFLKAFCGGHPRTIDRTTRILTSNIEHLLEDPKFNDYSRFTSLMLEKLSDFFSDTLLSSAHKDVLQELTNSEAFSKVKSWFLNKGSQGFILGTRPTSKDVMVDEEIKRLTYELMNIGIIVQNGQNNYYLSSYFHFLEFLKIYHDPYEEFLKQILNNKYFQLMCGSHSGFGYTFENILTASFIICSNDLSKDLKTPINFTRIKNIIVLDSSFDWNDIQIEENILYQTPHAPTIDGKLLQDGVLTLMQFTTARVPNLNKVDSLFLEMNKITRWPTQSWFVSLFPTKFSSENYKNLIITDGKDLIGILGENLFSRLMEVKNAL